jgi:hypothetical protein
VDKHVLSHDSIVHEPPRFTEVWVMLGFAAQQFSTSASRHETALSSAVQCISRACLLHAAAVSACAMLQRCLHRRLDGSLLWLT